jgi:RNA polymerase sigma-70 factor, ECF subfamily
MLIPQNTDARPPPPPSGRAPVERTPDSIARCGRAAPMLGLCLQSPLTLAVDGAEMTDYPDSSADALAQWLQAVAGGDRDAFERLYRATSSKLFGVCLRVLPDRAEAEDVLQEVYATVWRKAVQFDAARASAITWLAMIARNKAIDRLRSTPAGVRAAPMELAEAVPDPSASPLDGAESSDENARLARCMDRLDGDRRELVRTAFFEGVTYEDLAARIGSPLGTVKSWIRRSLLQLRACLEQ